MDPLKTESYDYTLPESYIATEPVSPRDSCKLLVYNRADGSIIHTVFSQINKFIPKEAAIVCNDTKVIKARLYGQKPTGGRIELLINKPLNTYEVSALIRGKVSVGMRLFFDAGLEAEVLALHEDGARTVQFFQGKNTLSFESLILVIDEIGHIPLPPYMQREDKESDSDEYQSVFSKNAGAVAAPTASLHFTPELFEATKAQHPLEFLTLHVGAGTFKPVEADTITDHPMHSEYYHIPQSAQELIDSDVPLLAIGTTVTRTVEFYVRAYQTEGEANLFLHPHNRPLRINHLLTNFHLPKSTLLMLVASFIGLEETQRVYAEAIKEHYRFFSYGDAMLIL